jgi:hypothetical protein
MGKKGKRGEREGNQNISTGGENILARLRLSPWIQCKFKKLDYGPHIKADKTPLVMVRTLWKRI